MKLAHSMGKIEIRNAADCLGAETSDVDADANRMETLPDAPET